MKTKSTEKLTNFFYEMGTLRKISRSHKQLLLTSDESDNIASHSFRTAVISYFLAKAEKADPYKVLIMSLFHDIPESRSGDQNWVHKKYIKVFDTEITADQIPDIPYKDDLLEFIGEYEKRQSKESKIAKDADSLDQVLLLKEYSWTGNKESEKWLEGKSKGKRLFTKTAKKWVKEIIQQNPSDWWKNLWTPDRR